MKKTLLCALVLLLPLVFDAATMSQSLQVTENLRHEAVVLPLTIPERARMSEIDRMWFVEPGGAAGMILFYDDPLTMVAVDYIEFYDLEGHLLLVSWIDRFGICQAAIDRGLLNEQNPKVERTMVMVELGTGL